MAMSSYRISEGWGMQLSASNKRYNSTVCLFMSPHKQKREGLLTDMCVMKTVLHSTKKRRLSDNTPFYTVIRRVTTFRSTTDRIYDSGPIILYYIILYYLLTYSLYGAGSFLRS